MSESKVVVFELSGVHYGINILQVQEIIRMVDITPVAEADMSLEGIVNLRGMVIPVINLSRRLGLQKKEKDQETRIVVVEFGGKKMGLVVDRVLEVNHYMDEDLENADVVGQSAECISGFVKKDNSIWMLLDVDAVIGRIQLSEQLDYAGAQ